MGMKLENGMLLLKRVSQYVDMQGNIYNMNTNGNLDDMAEGAVANIKTAPDTWFDNLTHDEYRAVDIIYGGIDGKS
jgi:hypothetical protein